MMHRIVWLASYPKSGNTWLRLFIDSVLRDGAAVDINNLTLPGKGAAGREVFGDFAGVEAADLGPNLVEQARPSIYRLLAEEASDRLFMKVHDAYTYVTGGAPLFPPDCTEAVLYVVRDPRDIAISLAMHTNKSLDEAIQLMGDPNATFGQRKGGITEQLPQRLLTWSEHVQSWLTARNIRLHKIHYESLLADPVATFAEAMNFLQIRKSVAVIERAVAATGFDVLRAQESSLGFKERPANATVFFRRGLAGAWQQDLSKEQIFRIESEQGDTMRELGYL